MEQDLFVDRYETYDDLRKYMRGSAGAVGMMMCYVVAEYQTDLCQTCARLLGEAMQLTNFLRDVGEDANRGRIYLPREDLESFGVREKDIFEHRATPEFKQLMRFQIARARALYFESDLGIALLPKKTRRPVELARSLYSRILNRLEAQDCDPFIRRARTSKTEKILVALNLTFGRR
jgi:phytoene synthase